MRSEFERWLGAVVLGLGAGGACWTAFRFTPWLPELPLWPCLLAWLAVALGLAWIGLPLFADSDWRPETPRAEAFERVRLRLLAHARPRSDARVRMVLDATGFGLMLALGGMIGSIFLSGGFWPSDGTGLRVLCFGGALVCAGCTAIWGGGLGRVCGAGLAALVFYTWFGLFGAA